MGPRQVRDVWEEDVTDDSRLLAVFAGVDLAMTFDYTAVAVTQVRERMRRGVPLSGQHGPDPRAKETFYRVQQVRRWPHNLAAPEIATGLVQLFEGIRAEMVAEQERGSVHGFTTSANPTALPLRAVFVDATGMGKAIVPSIRQSLGDNPDTQNVAVHPITFTYGERPYDPFHEDSLHGSTVGKLAIISTIQALVHSQRLDLPKDDPQSPLLRQEILDYRFAIDRDGHETFSSAPHDDLVIAVSLACLADPRVWAVTYGTVRY